MPLLYLLHLMTTPLPKVVTRLEDVRYVSVLKATGLVEADIAIALDPVGKYQVARTATVTRITEAGMAEINILLRAPRRATTTPPIAQSSTSSA
ncbi:hypothetical protein [Variovorax sp. DXTD-1]|uniref:hypothetical protein n=1 Tax=Variovorax sp. DXTD-1 TaxID=2495592 RepID=UPI000F89A938|nr:hypothetical protein [Variovorax sp. DXTD-1]RST52067.1 hypothetical protein EJI00_07865 [Variovorax sp. DXTD-1]